MFQNQRVFSVLDFKLFYNHAAFACIVKCRSFTLFFLNSSQVLSYTWDLQQSSFSSSFSDFAFQILHLFYDNFLVFLFPLWEVYSIWYAQIDPSLSHAQAWKNFLLQHYQLLHYFWVLKIVFIDIIISFLVQIPQNMHQVSVFNKTRTCQGFVCKYLFTKFFSGNQSEISEFK
jgi:hypothetical protein